MLAAFIPFAVYFIKLQCVCVSVYVSMGYIGPVCGILFVIISTVLNKFLMSPVGQLVFLQEQLEGDFR